MGIVYVRLPANISQDREKVSRVWSVVLHDMAADGVDSDVSEGHRTFARQGELVAEKGVWTPANPTGAALPSHNAPHIRTGRLDHALDFRWGADAAISWLARNGLEPRRTVPGEPWHVECPAHLLAAYYARRKAKLTVKGIGRVRTKAANTLLRRRRLRKAEGATGRGPRWRRLNRAVLRSQKAVVRYRNRAKSSRVKRILNRVLRDRDGRL